MFDGIKQGVQGDRKAYLARPAPGRVPRRQAAGDQCGDAGDDRSRRLRWRCRPSVAATAACVDAFAKTDFRPELAAVKVPTLVLHGTADIPVPFAIGKATAGGHRPVEADRIS